MPSRLNTHIIYVDPCSLRSQENQGNKGYQRFILLCVTIYYNFMQILSSLME